MRKEIIEKIIIKLVDLIKININIYLSIYIYNINTMAATYGLAVLGGINALNGLQFWM